jgi:hypothetical protein
LKTKPSGNPGEEEERKKSCLNFRKTQFMHAQLGHEILASEIPRFFIRLRNEIDFYKTDWIQRRNFSLAELILVKLEKSISLEKLTKNSAPTKDDSLKIPGSNLARVKVIRKAYFAALLSQLNIHCHCVYLRKINA